jgi:hypothetical protein
MRLLWLDLPQQAPAFTSIYKIDEGWSPESKERLRRNVAAA